MVRLGVVGVRRRFRRGAAGLRYVQALSADGQLDEALAVCAELWARGYVIGLTEAAWVERDQGDFPAAIASMESAIEHLDGDEQLSAIGIVGCWRWHYLNDVGAERQLRQGMSNYGSAWADLGHLLKATGRAAEGKQVLMDGAVNDILECMLPLTNLLSRAGDRDRAEALYRRAYDLGDGHSAWNLAIDLAEDGRFNEAADWRWKAAAMGDELAIAHLANDEWLERE